MSEVTGAAPAADTGNASDTSVQETTDETNSQEGAAQTPAQTAALKKKYKLKVDGKEFEEEIDFSNEEDIRNRLQRAHAADKRMSEAQETKKKAAEILKKLDENPEELLRRLGPKGREIAEKYLLSQIEDEMLSPEQKAARSEKSELEILREEKKKREEAEIAKTQQAKELDIAKGFQATIITAIEKSGLPKSPELVKKMASIMAKNLEFGLDLTPDDLIQEVRSDVVGMLKSVIKDSDGAQLVALFGEDVANKIRKFDISKLQARGQSSDASKRDAESATIKPPQGRTWMSTSEWREQLDQKIK